MPYLETVVACPLTSTLHPAWRSRLLVSCAGRPAEVAVDQIRALAKARLVRQIGQLSPEDALKLRLLITEMYGQSA